jgi:ribosomal protein S18 acetylase RimI-like enzyme
MILLDDEQVIGCGVIRHKWSREIRRKSWWLYAIWINPIHRGKGYGKILMQELLSEVKKRKIKQIGLTVDEDNIVAQNLYKKIGFVKIGKSKQQIIMRYDL